MAGEIILSEVSTPSTPSSGKESLFISNDATPKLKRITSAGSTRTVLEAGEAAPAGTATVAPLQFTSGTNLTTAAAGAFEYDGTVPYLTPNASNRAVDAVIHFTSNVADFGLANSSSAQSPFEAARDVITLPASTSYIMEGLVQITGMGGTTRTTALEFDAGSATLTAISYFATIYTGAAQTITTTFGVKHSIAATAQVLNATVATAAATIWWKGIVRINAAGTFIPQIKFSADPTGTILCEQDSFFQMTPIGSNTVGSVGNWA